MAFPTILLSLLACLFQILGFSQSYEFWLWILIFLICTAFIWNREPVNPFIISLPSCYGLYLNIKWHEFFLEPSLIDHILLSLNSLGFVGSIYAGTLGHFYLNIPGLPLKFLRRSTLFYTSFLILELFMIIGIYFKQKPIYYGDAISLISFMKTFEGFFLAFALFLGTVFSLSLSFMALHIIRLKNTQAATGLLYVIGLALIMTHILYKYYALTYKVFL